MTSNKAYEFSPPKSIFGLLFFYHKIKNVARIYLYLLYTLRSHCVVVLYQHWQLFSIISHRYWKIAILDHQLKNNRVSHKKL